jgi:Cu+-exporting ATPase
VSEPASVASSSSADNDSNDSNDGIQLAITGATCASCVSSIEKTLKSVSGVTHAHMNLADNTASASGQATSQALINAVESAGYGASVIEDPDRADEHRQQQDRKRYRTLLVKMAISLSLGVGLMIWGMGFGSMTIDAGNQTTWINLGILTLGVMIATGSHFFTSAWKAFAHHNANMDTLVDAAEAALGGPIDILFANHGGPPLRTALEVSQEEIATQLNPMILIYESR